MTGKGKKTQATIQRSTKIIPSKNRNQTEDRELKRQLSELQSKFEQEHKQNILLQSNNEKLIQENTSLRQKNTRLQNQIDINNNNIFLKSLSSSLDGESDDATRPAKRQMRKKPSDEEEKAKALMKVILKNLRPEDNLRDGDTFRSKVNTEICQKLIPKLQKEMKVYNPSYEQVETWLQSLHRNKRSIFLKSNQSNQSNLIDDYEIESDDDIQPAKQQMKSKGKKPVNYSEDEIEEGAKTIMKVILNNLRPEDNLKHEDTFKSEANTEICQKLVPRLLKEVKPYNLSYKQVENWLQTWHRNKRSIFLKSNHMIIDDY